MEFLRALTVWAKGDAQQGKIMLGIGLLLVLFLYLILKSENQLLNGMLIPVGLLLIGNLGYGSYLLYSRAKHIATTTELYQQNPKETIQKELTKMQADSKSYTMIKRVWAVLIVISVIAFFFLKNDYFKGLALGFLCLSVSFLLLDTLLHQRLKPYVEILTNSIH
ncbi:hypothetical protein [Chryseobacterium oryctis]|uniref:Uncharacterized protein n=1 Tax=Chryseobacterium oryctis TaxID=2952618 RepID=A0ABT3HK49_9FLAO|nr:hypothetical protein [Chryseobacterium oryctis]MCW3160170.1 hypothetical protein [Chryseobacterium oryctis]